MIIPSIYSPTYSMYFFPAVPLGYDVLSVGCHKLRCFDCLRRPELLRKCPNCGTAVPVSDGEHVCRCGQYLFICDGRITAMAVRSAVGKLTDGPDEEDII